MALSASYDHAQRRIADDRVQVAAYGYEFDTPLFSDTFIDPVTGTLMLRPAPLYAAWYTQDTGAFAKLNLVDFGLSADPAWETRAHQHGLGPWLCRRDSATNGAAITTATFGRNRGFYVAWFGYGAGETFVQFRCGWHSSATLAGGVGVEVGSDGHIHVYRDGALIESGRVGARAAGGKAQGQLWELILLPCRHRELLILTPGLDGFSVAFEEIAESDTSPTITPSARFWFHVVHGATQVQVAPLLFASFGHATSVPLSFAQAPASAEPLEQWQNGGWVGTQGYRLLGHPAYVGTQAASLSLRTWLNAPFTANGTAQNCRIRCDLTTNDPAYTPFVYYGLVGYAGRAVNTAHAALDVSGHTRGAALSVPEAASGVEASLTLGDAEALESTVNRIRRIGCRPVELRLGTARLLDGIADAPEYEDDQANVVAEVMEVRIRDRWRLLEDYTFTEPVALDGLGFADALRFLVGRAGIDPAHTAISATTFRLPFTAGARSDDLGVLIEVGDTAAEWITRLMADYAATWLYGFRPTATRYEFYALDPADLGTAPAITLYASRAAALAGGVAEADLARRTYYSLRRTVIEPEANDIRVTGWNPRKQRPFQVSQVDALSMDPALAPALRPDNWLGVQRRYGLVDPAITTPEAAEFACRVLHSRLTPARDYVEWEGELLLDASGVPLWRGANVRLVGHGVYRIETFDVAFELETTGASVRRARYTAWRIANEPT